MKKNYIFLSLLAISTLAVAQQKATGVISSPVGTENIAPPPVQPMAGVDTLAGHTAGGTFTIYTSGNGGYVAGHNGYNDISKAQLFDNGFGVTGAGQILGIAFWFAGKEGNPASTVSATIWNDVSGNPGTVLGSTNITFAQIDTSAAATFGIGSPIEGAYNTVATFTPPLNIPGNMMFWAGIRITYAAGDTVGLVTTTDPEFAQAVTHTFEQWSDNSWHTYNDGTGNTWQLDIAQCIYPIVNIGSGINEDGLISFSMYPNPSKGLVNVALGTGVNDATMKVFNVLGEEVFSKQLENTFSSFSLESLSKGSYFVTISNEHGTGTQKLVIN